MRSSWVRSRFHLRSGWRATCGLILVVGLAGGLALAGLAGARRTDEAIPRFLRYSRPADTFIILYRDGLGVAGAQPFELPQDPDELTDALDQLRALPEIAYAHRGTDVAVARVDETSPSGFRPQRARIHFDPGGSEVFGRPLIVAGRLAQDDRADEVVINEQLARLQGLDVGSIYRAAPYSREQTAEAFAGAPTVPAHPVRDLRVVGIARRTRGLLPPVTDQSAASVLEEELYLTPAYFTAYAGDVAIPGAFIGARRRNGLADMERLTSEVTRLFGASAEVLPFREINLGEEERRSLERAVSYEAGGLRIFAALVAVAALVFIAQALVRQNAEEAKDDVVFRALGMTKRQLIASSVLRTLPIAAGGAAVAVGVAIAMSPLAILGVARRAALDRGVAVDAAVLSAGGVSIIAAVLVLAALAALWQHRSRSATTRRVGVVARLGGVGLRPTAAVGTGFALDPGRGAGAVPSRPAIGAVLTAVVGLLMAAVVLTSFDGLVSNPGRFGVGWDIQVGVFQTPDQPEAAAATLAEDPDVAGFAGFRIGGLVIDGRDVQAMALFAPTKREVPVEVLAGRTPATPDEIGLGAATMRELGLSVGDRVEVGGGEGPAATMRVVGKVVVPAGGVDYELGPGRGALVTSEVLATRYPAVAFPFSYVMDLVAGTDRNRKAAELEQSFPQTVVIAPLPADLRNLRQAREVPVALAAVVAVLAVAALVHALVSVIRRRRRDLAILKTIGFTRRQLSGIVAWQATVIAGVGVVIGLPVGLAGGRWLWRWVSTQLGVAPHPVVPAAWVAVVVVSVFVVANLIAAIPGWFAGRIPAAVVLRSE